MNVTKWYLSIEAWNKRKQEPLKIIQSACWHRCWKQETTTKKTYPFQTFSKLPYIAVSETNTSTRKVHHHCHSNTRCPVTCVHRVPGSWRFECARDRGKPAFFSSFPGAPASVNQDDCQSCCLKITHPVFVCKSDQELEVMTSSKRKVALPTLSWLNENNCVQLGLKYLDFRCHKLFEIHIVAVDVDKEWWKNIQITFIQRCRHMDLKIMSMSIYYVHRKIQMICMKRSEVPSLIHHSHQICKLILRNLGGLNGYRASRCKMATMTTLRATTWMSPACRSLQSYPGYTTYSDVSCNKQKQASISRM